MRKLYKAAYVAFIFIFMLILGGKNIYGADLEKVYEYGDEGIVEDYLELKIEAESGKNYEITVDFTGITNERATISLGYDKVTNDQMVGNIYASDDRSGLMDEAVISGKIETRTFMVAALEDRIVINAWGKGKITKIIAKEIENQNHTTTVYTIGDSLVQTYSQEYAPQTGWGQMLQEYFNSNNLQVKNYALGGRSTGSFLREGRLNQVLINIQEGDYVLIEFGHNDASKDKEDRYVSVEDYKVLLREQYIRAIEQRGGIPVLVTLVNRNDYNSSTGVFNVSFERYVTAMKEVAKETGVKLIDLNGMTVEYFTKMNKEYGIGITEALIYNHSKPGEYSGAYSDGVSDNTHLQKYGAKLVAGMVARSLSEFGEEVLCNNYIMAETADKMPETPTGLKMKNNNWIAGSIQWTLAEGADFYKIYVADITDGEEEYQLAGYSSSGEFMYEDVTIFKTYKFKVVAVNSAGESSESEEFVFEAKNNVEDSNAVSEQTSEEENSTNIEIIVTIAAIIVVVIIIVIAAIIIQRKKST